MDKNEKKSLSRFFRNLGRSTSNMMHQEESSLNRFLGNLHQAASNMIHQFDTDPLISKEVQTVLSNPKDKKIFLEALHNLKDMEDGVPLMFEVSSGKMGFVNNDGPKIIY